MRKIFILIVNLMVFLFSINYVKADILANDDVNYDYYCTKEAASQLAKIVFMETGTDTAVNSDENFFMRISTAAVAINNANRKSGYTFYQKLYNLTDSNYAHYSTYKDKSFESVVPSNRRGEFLYIAELVLTGKYAFPSNMTLQASKEIVEKWGTVWTFIDSKTGYYDVYFGYEQNSMKTTDIYGNPITNTSPQGYINMANRLKLSSYSAYNLNNVCTGLSSSTPGNDSSQSGSGNSNSGNNSMQSTAFSTCTNPDILRVIYFFLIIIDIVKIIIPIALIVLGLIDFSKSVTASDEKVQKKTVNLFVKRIVYAVLVFAIPWIVEFLMVVIGDAMGNLNEVNWTDCIEYANSECIREIEGTGSPGTICNQ